tara:strand:+ start:7468 stop:8103 length:636 start_codon:yes stop_codon:yes gene_type:complete
MNDYIDIYCERLHPGLWAEPLNAATNAAFIVAALCAYILARQEKATDVRALTLIGLMCVIGVGSTLFHTFATALTQLSDVLPILFYQIAFIWFYALYVMRLAPLKTAGLFVVFIVLTVLSEMAPSYILNGSLSYAPSILFLLGFGVWHAKTGQRDRYVLILAAGVFALSLMFRSIDMAVCPHFEIGTHYIWHILNGCVLYLATRGYIKNAR